LDKKDQEKLSQYREELNRLPEDQQKPYLEGYLQGLLTSKGSTSQVPPPRKSIMPRIYVAIVIAIILAFWTGGMNYFRIYNFQFLKNFVINFSRSRPCRRSVGRVIDFLE
jgi:hypothetical protein